MLLAKRSQESYTIIANTALHASCYYILADDGGSFVARGNRIISANAGDTIGKSTSDLGSEGALWFYLIDM